MPGSSPALHLKLGHYPISEVDGRSHGDLVGGKGLAGPLSSLFRSVFGLAIGDPSLAGPFFLAEVGWLKMIRSVSAASIRCLSTRSKTMLTITATKSTRHAARAKSEVASVLDSARRLDPVAARAKSRARDLRHTRRVASRLSSLRK